MSWLGNCNSLEYCSKSLLLHEPSSLAASMLLISRYHFVACLERDAIGDITHAVGDVVRHCNLWRRGVDKFCHFRPDTHEIVVSADEFFLVIIFICPVCHIFRNVP